MILVELCPLRKLKEKNIFSSNTSECHNHAVSLQCVYEMEYFSKRMWLQPFITFYNV